MYSSYDYPPSSFIKQFGPIVEEAHYFAKGQILTGIQNIDCEFEVAYTQECKIIVICYTKPLGDISGFPNVIQINGVGLRMHRHSLTQGQELEIRNCRFIDTLAGLEAGGTILAFWAEQFIVNDGAIDSFHYLKTTHKRYVDSDSGYHYSITGIPRNTYPLECHFDGFYLQLSGGDDTIPQYSNQPNSSLEIQGHNIPSHLTPDDIATIACAMLSLAIGRDIQWLHRSVVVIDIEVDYQGYVIQHLWTSKRSVFGQRIAKPMVSHRWSGLKGLSEEFVNYLEISVGNAIKLPLLHVYDYINVIRHFIEYQLMTERKEDQARLIATTIEELLAKWSVNNSIKKQGFGTSLENFFASPIHLLSRLEASDINSKIKDFIDTRNEIAHQGHFFTNDIEAEFQNMLSILPLMIFTIFGYNEELE